MSAPVRVERKVFTDPRYAMLGQRLGVSKFDAIGRMALVWGHCTELETSVVQADVLDALVDRVGFAAAMVAVGLGEELPEGIRVRGTEGRIEWLADKRRAGKRGGQAKAANREVDYNGLAESWQKPSTTPSTPLAGSYPPTPATTPAPATTKNTPRGVSAEVLSVKQELLRLHPGHAFTGREASCADELIALAGVGEVLVRLRFLYSPQCPSWIQASGRDLSTLRNLWNKLAPPPKPRTAPEPTYTPPQAIPAEEAQGAWNEALGKLAGKFNPGGE